MQNRSRAYRCAQIYGKFRKSQVACFISRKVVFLFLFFIFSCAHKSDLQREFSSASFDTIMKKMSLTSSGKGRIQFLNERYSFSYESLLQPKLHEWSLALTAPVLGEEVFKVLYGRASENKVLVTGSFYERLQEEAGKSKQQKYYLDLLDQYLLGFGTFLFVFEQAQKNPEICQKGQCSIPQISRKLFWSERDGMLKMTLKLNESLDFILEFFEGDNTCFKRSRIYLKENQQYGKRKNPVEIELYLSACEG